MYITLFILLLGLLNFALGDAGSLRRNNGSPSSTATPSNDTSSFRYFDDSSDLNPLAGPQFAWHGEPPSPASDQVWSRYKCKGRKMLLQMSLSDFDVGQMLPSPQTTAQSPWFSCQYPFSSHPSLSLTY